MRKPFTNSTQYKPTPKPPIVRDGDKAFIPLTQGEFAIIDAADLDMISPYNWSLVRPKPGRTYLLYAQARINGKTIQMHRFLLGVGKGVIVDHRNQNGLDCRRDNLRPCNPSQSLQNTRKRRDNKSGYRGVWFDPKRKKFSASIKHSGYTHFLGLFPTAEQAAAVYQKEAQLAFGEFYRAS